MSVLTSSDGAFSCASGHALEVAYMLSTAEHVIIEHPEWRGEVGDILADYCAGQLAVSDARSALRDLTS